MAGLQGNQEGGSSREEQRRQKQRAASPHRSLPRRERGDFPAPEEGAGRRRAAFLLIPFKDPSGGCRYVRSRHQGSGLQVMAKRAQDPQRLVFAGGCSGRGRCVCCSRFASAERESRQPGESWWAGGGGDRSKSFRPWERLILLI